MPEIVVDLIVRAKDETSATLKGMSTASKDFGAGLNNAIKGATGLDLASVSLAGGLTALGAGLKYAIDQAAEGERVMAQTEAVVKSTGMAAGLTADDIANMAGQLSTLNAVDDEVIQSGANVLLTFKSIGRDAFEPTMQAALDMSAALGTSLQGAIMQVGKALDNPVAGMTALRRSGVSFTEQQKETVKQLVATGRAAEAQALILAELNSEFGGSGAAAAATYAGQMKLLQIETDNFAQSIGARLLPILTDAVKAINTLITWDTRLTGVLSTHSGQVLATAESYDAYAAELERAAKEAGYLVNAQGDLVKANYSNWGVTETVIEANYRLSQANYDAARSAEDLREQNRLLATTTEEVAYGGAAMVYSLTSLGEVSIGAAGKVAELDSAWATFVSNQAATMTLKSETAARNLETAFRDAATAGDDLAMSLLGISQADLAAKAIDMLREKADQTGMSATTLATAEQQVMLAYGLATPATLAQADALTTLTGLMATGQITSDQYTTAIGGLRQASADGTVTMGELGIAIETKAIPAMGAMRDNAGDASGALGGMGQAALDAQAAIDAMHDKTVTITTIMITRSQQDEAIALRAHGGPVEAGQPYLVGERGPELIVPRTSGTVLPAGETARALGDSGGGTYIAPGAITVNAAPGMDAGQVAQAVMVEIARRTRANINSGAGYMGR